MTSVLVVDDDPPLRRALVRDLRANGYEAVAASGYDEAVDRAKECEYDVLLTDLRMGSRDGLDLILTLSGAAPRIRPIMMSAYATAHDSERAMALGAVRVLCKPFESDQLIQAVERAVRSTESFSGSVHGLSLVDLLQMYHFARRSVTLHLRGHSTTSISLREGEIVDARHAELRGQAALCEILSLSAGVVETTELSVEETTLRGRFESTLLEALHANDEQATAGGRDAEAALEALQVTDDLDESPPESAVDELGALCQRLVREVSGAAFCGIVHRESHCVLAARSEDDVDPPSRLASSPSVDALTHFEEVHGRSGDTLHFARRVGSAGAALLLVMREAQELDEARRLVIAASPSFERALERLESRRPTQP